MYFGFNPVNPYTQYGQGGFNNVQGYGYNPGYQNMYGVTQNTSYGYNNYGYGQQQPMFSFANMFSQMLNMLFGMTQGFNGNVGYGPQQHDTTIIEEEIIMEDLPPATEEEVVVIEEEIIIEESPPATEEEVVVVEEEIIIEEPWIERGDGDGDGDPLMLDIAGKGINLTSAENGVQFDLDGDGVKEQVAWTQANGADTNSWLVLDDAKDGGAKGVQSGKELFGDQHGDANGFERLKQFDDNGDGVIDSQDAVYDDLELWQDRNGDGISQADEMTSLKDNGVSSISLNYDANKVQDAFGNGLQHGQFTRSDGTIGSAVNAWVKMLQNS